MSVMLEIIWEIMRGVATQTPFWVWPLLVGLVVLGLRARATRQSPVWPYYAIPFLSLMPLSAVSRMTQPMAAWAGFVIGFAVCIVWAYAYQGRRIEQKDAQRVTVQGEWVTMITVMTVFWANFAQGVLQSVAPDVLHSAPFIGLFATILGACAGCFIGRSVRIVTWPTLQADTPV